MMVTHLIYASVDSPFGTVWLARSDHGIARLLFSEDPGVIPSDAALEGDGADYAPDELTDAVHQLEGYFAGQRQSFDLDVDLLGYYAHAWESPDRGVRRKLELLHHEGVELLE